MSFMVDPISACSPSSQPAMKANRTMPIIQITRSRCRRKSSHKSSATKSISLHLEMPSCLKVQCRFVYCSGSPLNMILICTFLVFIRKNVTKIQKPLCQVIGHLPQNPYLLPVSHCRKEIRVLRIFRFILLGIRTLVIAAYECFLDCR